MVVLWDGCSLVSMPFFFLGRLVSLAGVRSPFTGAMGHVLSTREMAPRYHHLLVCAIVQGSRPAFEFHTSSYLHLGRVRLARSPATASLVIDHDLGTVRWLAGLGILAARRIPGDLGVWYASPGPISEPPLLSDGIRLPQSAVTDGNRT